MDVYFITYSQLPAEICFHSSPNRTNRLSEIGLLHDWEVIFTLLYQDIPRVWLMIMLSSSLCTKLNYHVNVSVLFYNVFVSSSQSGDNVLYGMTASHRYIEPQHAGTFTQCSQNVNNRFAICWFTVLLPIVLSCKFPFAQFADMEWQTPAVSEKFQSRFGRRPGTADSGDTGLGTSASDSTEGDDFNLFFPFPGMCCVTLFWRLLLEVKFVLFTDSLLHFFSG